MPRSPLPQRFGLEAAWVRTPGERDWATMREYLLQKMTRVAPERVDEMFAEGRWHDEEGRPLAADAPYRPHSFVWFHRDLPDEAEVPFDIPVVFEDDRILVVDKPHFLSTIPRGQHIRQTAVVRLRTELGLPELGPAHRLDRATAGLLLLTKRRELRGAYQQIFAHREVVKAYRAVARVPDPAPSLPATVRSHIRKDRGVLQAYEVADAPPNAETDIEALTQVRPGLPAGFRVVPHTGRTHQIRLHFQHLGMPLLNDPLYPAVRDVPLSDFGAPLQLLAAELSFRDPIDGSQRSFTSGRTLDLWPTD